MNDNNLSQGGFVKGRMICHADISREYGIPSRDILIAVQQGRFPTPVWINGRKRWFDRAEVEEFLYHRGDR